MNLSLVGINHRTAPIEVRERMNIQESRLAEALPDRARREGILEGLILSTCNRVEVVTNSPDNVQAEPIIRQFLAECHHCDLTPYERYFYTYRQQDVVRHLFRVASSLDSMILGEPQILGQMKQAYAVALAQAFHGTAIRFEELLDFIDKADIVISSTGAPHFVVRKEQAEKLLAARKNRPIFFIDIAVPRDIDPAVNELENAFVYDIDDLEQVVEANRKQREREAVWAEEIVRREVQKMMRRLASNDVVPTIKALERRLEQIRQSEMERVGSRLGARTPDQREAVDALVRGIINKILHGPITELKSRAGGPEQGTLVQLIRKIFGVGD